MAQIHFDERPVDLHCNAEIWPGGMPHTGGDLRYAELILGGFIVTMDEEEFLTLLDEMNSAKKVLGW